MVNKKHHLQDEILVEVKTIYNVNLRELGINPESTPIERIKETILKELNNAFYQDECYPILHKANILKHTAITKSVPNQEDEDSSSN